MPILMFTRSFNTASAKVDVCGDDDEWLATRDDDSIKSATML